MRLKTVISGLVAGCLLATGSQLWAQNTNTTPTTPPNQPPQIHAPTPGGPGAPQARTGVAGILSEEQQASFQKVNAELRDKMTALQSKLQAAQREVFEAGMSPKFDENLVREKAQAAAQIWADMLVARAKAPSEIQPPLTAEQIEKIKDMERPPTNPRMLRPQVPPGASTNHDQNGLPPKP
jgi:Spy/CpxP family protein refolding chaperone